MTLAAQLEKHLPATLTAPGLSEADFLALAEEFPDCFLEYTPEGTVLITPPTDPETSARIAEVTFQLKQWAKAEGRGIVLGPDGGFFFPDGSRRSPDAAWFNAARWRKSQRPGTRFPTFAPEFLIEVRSPEQRSRPLREKMEEYIANGVQLGWLIDPIARTVEIYRPGHEPEVLDNPATLAGEGPVAGFVLDLNGIL
ncbi:MAG TPA: Uma2 family endonuclease [Bryobacteraceae bacterium]|jgi:Uma2 family endonuclease